MSITQMNEKQIIPLNDKLPRGAIANTARKHGLSLSAVYYVASGHITTKPEIYAELLEIAEKHTEITKNNFERASKL